MKRFNVFTRNGEELELVLGEIKKIVSIKIEVIKLGNLIDEKEIGTIVFKSVNNNVYLRTSKGIVKLTQEIIDYIAEKTNANINDTIYKYSTEYKNNYLD